MFSQNLATSQKPAGARTTFGSNLFPNLNPAPELNAAIQPSQITLKTKYDDLPKEAKAMINQIERFVQDQVYDCSIIESRLSTNMIENIRNEAKKWGQMTLDFHNVLTKDKILAHNLLKAVKNELKSEDTIVRFIKSYKGGNTDSTLSHKFDPYMKYFFDLLERNKNILKANEERVEELELFASSYDESKYDPGVIIETIKNQEKLFASVANLSAKLQAEISERMKEFAYIRKKYFGDDSFMKVHTERFAKNNSEEIPPLEVIAQELLTPLTNQQQR